MNFEPIQESMEEVLFETYGFGALHRTVPHPLVKLGHSSPPSSSGGGGRPSANIALVVDTGFSFTSVCGVMSDKVIMNSVKRIDVGGKLLTNYLKEIVSYRAFNMMDETALINDVKEQLCFTSLNFDYDIRSSQERLYDKASMLRRDFVLPDYKNILKGFVKPIPSYLPPSSDGTSGADAEGPAADPSLPSLTGEEQCLTMNTERISIPEILFHPSDIGISQGGVAEAVVQSVNSAHPHLHEHLYRNIIVTGGNSLFENFIPRLSREVRSLAPVDFEVNIHHAKNPLTCAWEGGSRLTTQENFKSLCVTKQEYQEHGHNICAKRFSVYV
jgi:actin-related protein 6